jgi:predicted nucleic acid-binding protein
VTSASGRDPVVVDTGVLAAGLTARTEPLAARYRDLLVGRPLIITVQTISELYFGALKSSWGAPRLRKLDERLARAVIAPCDDHLARTAAQLRLDCLRLGHPLAQKFHANDLWVAATSVRYGIALVSDDHIFAGVPGLQLLTPAP